jgi:hypothetical protein
MGPISRRPAVRRGLLLLCLILLVLAAAATAPAGAAVTLGPDLSVKPCVGQQACFAAIGCQAGQYSPCSYVNLHSNSATVPVASPIKGVVTRWRFRAGCCTETQTAPRTMTLKTFKPGIQDGSFGYSFIVPLLTGNSFVIPVGNLVSSDPFVELPSRLPIAVGERVGVVADNPIDFAVYSPTQGVISTVVANATFYNGEAYGNPIVNVAIAISADVEPDADNDGYGDESQDCAPTDPTKTGGCPPPSTGPIINPPVGGGGPCRENCHGGGVVIIMTPSYPPSGDGSKIYIPLSCPAAATQPCGGFLIITQPPPPKKSSTAASGAAKAKVLARVRYSVSPGKTKKVLVKLSKTGKKLLKRKGRLKVVITARPSDGAAVSVRRTLKWRAKRSR